MLCDVCKNKPECTVTLPEFVTEFGISRCRNYVTTLTIPKGVVALRKALEKFAQKGCSTPVCDDCVLDNSGVCDLLFDVIEAIDGAFPAEHAESAREN